MVVKQPWVSYQKIILSISFIYSYGYSCVSTLMVALSIFIFPVESKVYKTCLFTSLHELLVRNHKVDFMMWSFKRL